ncbi:phosphomannose isomerase type I family protein [Cryptosporidium muris RN66]|uniref:mannose-6-phosphate isomerase n=1 Tax=Cryptosporidium muris (strain RN66) TaxID=441375 RepID=B6AB31_CRYMR|nr:phosphomannose isomerase type I family protein [Cryptosporidium muris RN66]EEA05583.1 phosphomannose isomerase type I family protein [Cryptosporidium muris RN66]|eukprot:XP_002139932.1 phosphomannose isomerase type I family protein [Cryptosporidium muris RN66]
MDKEIQNIEYLDIFPTIKHYDWGVLGKNSMVYSLSKHTRDLNYSSKEISLPFAELWYGTHKSGPSFVYINDGNIINLNKALNNLDNDFLGISYTNKSFINNTQERLDLNNLNNNYVLPFLLKILSISKPLSLQVHPNHNVAKELFNEQPNIYLDPNPKPEIAIALTKFEALCGFRKYEDIIETLKEYPELSLYLNLDHNNNNNSNISSKTNSELLKYIFTKLLNISDSTIIIILKSIIHKLEKKSEKDINIIDSLILRLHTYFPYDFGIISPIFLNYFQLEPGDSLFIGDGTIHSYLLGECVECMGNSDNVIRCGLTTKYKDKNTLLRALNFDNNTFYFWKQCETQICNYYLNTKLELNHINSNLLYFLHTENLNFTTPIINDYKIYSINQFHIQKLNFVKSNSIFKKKLSSTSPIIILCINGQGEIFLNKSQSIVKLYQGKCIIISANSDIIIKSSNYLLIIIVYSP